MRLKSSCIYYSRMYLRVVTGMPPNRDGDIASRVKKLEEARSAMT